MEFCEEVHLQMVDVALIYVRIPECQGGLIIPPSPIRASLFARGQDFCSDPLDLLGQRVG